MKFALGQLNPTLGDFVGNGQLIETALRQAEAAAADVLVLPELALCGYPPRDLLHHTAFLDDCEQALARLAAQVGNTAVIVGLPHRRPGAAFGRPLANAAAFLFQGRVVAIGHKRLLPTYDVFDEDRYFQPGFAPMVVPFRGLNLGISICEDAWNDSAFWRERRYPIDPLEELVAAGADILINLSASPFGVQKRQQRQDMLVNSARRLQRPLVFVNQVGGHDDVIFDGASLAIDSQGSVVARAEEHAPDLITVQVGGVEQSCQGELRERSDDITSLMNALVMGTRDYARRCGFRTALLGLSGGIDSAVVACIAARALGPNNVYAVALPSRYSSTGSLDDARDLANNLGIHFSEMPIEAPFAAYLQTLAPQFEGRASDVTEENLQARIRGGLLMALSNKFGHLLLTTGNKSELSVGYCTLYGDMCGGLAVISDVFKLQVYELARRINRDGVVIPLSTIDKPPSAELRPDQKDEDSLPPYAVLDPLLKLHIEDNVDAAGLVAAGFEAKVVQGIVRMVRLSEYKRWQMPPGLKVSPKAFGTGRRYPIAHGFRDQSLA